MPEILDYDLLVAEFEDGLVNRLRGHAVSKEFLELWVPDENPVKGVLSMIEAAEASGQDDLTIEIAAARFGPDEVVQLRTYLGEGARLDTEMRADRLRLRYARRGAGLSAARLGDVAACFRAGIAHRLENLAFDGPLPAGDHPATAIEADAALGFAVDPDTHVVTEARHWNVGDPVSRAVLDMVCALSRGRPLREVRDHVLTKAIEALRDEHVPVPVAGIRLPTNIDPAFLPARRLIGTAYAAYAAATGYEPGINFYEEPPSPAWLALTDQERDARVTAALERFLAAENLPAGEVRLTGIVADRFRHPVRVFIRFQGAVPARHKAALLRALERRLKREVEPTLHLYNETAKDESSLRRL